MLARMYSKKKKRPLQLTGCPDGGDNDGDFGAGAARHVGPNMPQHHHGALLTPPPPQPPSRRSQSSRLSRVPSSKDEDNRRVDGGGGGLKKLFSNKQRATHGGDNISKYTAAGGGGGGGGAYHDDRGDYDSYDDGCEGEVEEESDDEPQLHRPRRRFVRSGLTSYEQWISKNAMGRRFNRPSLPLQQQQQQQHQHQQHSPVTADGPSSARRPATMPSTPVLPMQGNEENTPSNKDHQGAVDGVSAKQAAPCAGVGMTSLSSALQEVIHSRPRALRGAADAAGGPQKVVRSFVVEQTPEGDFFVASRRVPHGEPLVPVPVPLRTKDDSFIGMGREMQVLTAEAGATTSSSEFEQHHAAATRMRRSEMDMSFRSGWGAQAVVKSSSSSRQRPVAQVISTGAAGLRRRLSNSDRGPLPPAVVVTKSNQRTSPKTDVHGHHHGHYGHPRRDSSSSRSSQVLLNQMAHKYIDHMRQRSSSRTSDGAPPPLPRSRKESTTAMLQAESFDDSGPIPMMRSSVDKGPMTMDEFFGSSLPPPLPVAVVTKPVSRGVFTNGKSSSSSSSRSKKKSIPAESEEDEVDNMMMNSFRNLKDVDALKRSRSLEDHEKDKDKQTETETTTTATTAISMATHTEETETDDDFPDYGEERATEDYGSSCDEDSNVRNSNITDFLGGFKSRNSMNRNSLLAGRNSLGGAGRKDDFVSRATRSLRNSRKAAAQESIKVSSELSRKLRDARGRVPVDLRGDPPPPSHKKRGGFLRRERKTVRFDMTRYVREFEVVEPEEDSEDDHEVQRWQQRDSEQDDDDDEDEEDEDELSNPSDYENDIGVPIPGQVIAAAVAEGTPYFSTVPSAFPADMRYNHTGTGIGNNPRSSQATKEDARVSVVSRRSNANQFEVFL